MRTRLASYNIRKCLGSDRQRLPGRTLDVINALSADVVALQEVDRRYAPRPFALPPGLIAAQTDFAPVDAAQSPESLGWHGQTVLLRRGLVAQRIERLELPALEPRGALAVEVAGGGAPYRVVCVHLGLMRRWRRLQLAAIREALAGHADMPTVILGDFNEWSVSGGMEPLTDAFHVHAPGRSFPASQPIGRLDRVALGMGLHLLDAGVLDTPLARVASDHLPIWADVRMDAKARQPAAAG
ncbi:metal-dependent hydrolase [Frigidibacter albus]|uniref:Metal-dependent hydrolase n=1 Tax=Frigidibacter albus TaxID=1465486 RepID=A0A6L8VEM8_9RHOB|nr:endonuclease/exonuclease/phosphatase family protein [Frigidibacter albus]MZQ88166.1 metal-dependent hydrolase [Frigidibacter albus]NBE30160.1 metal-dependent hydrolase [Frigidibacter albus]GGH47088.1 diguanylate cyclase [Frigidibacter albus]